MKTLLTIAALAAFATTANAGWNSTSNYIGNGMTTTTIYNPNGGMTTCTTMSIGNGMTTTNCF